VKWFAAATNGNVRWHTTVTKDNLAWLASLVSLQLSHTCQESDPDSHESVNPESRINTPLQSCVLTGAELLCCAVRRCFAVPCCAVQGALPEATPRYGSGSSMKQGHHVCRCTGWVNVWRGDGSFRSHEYRCVSSMV
jgi:hypothetical protein